MSRRSLPGSSQVQVKSRVRFPTQRKVRFNTIQNLSTKQAEIQRRLVHKNTRRNNEFHKLLNRKNLVILTETN